MSSLLSHLQLSLLEQDFGASPADRAFVDAWLANGGNAVEAMLVARPELKRASAKVAASRKLKAAMEFDPDGKRADQELFRYRAWKQAQLVMRAALTEDELVEKTRRIYLHGVGDLPVRKSMVSRSESGKVTVDEVEVREPSLSAANAAVELLRKIGGFGKDLEQPGGALVFELHLAGKPAEDKQAGAHG